jgi:hypothetical protein
MSLPTWNGQPVDDNDTSIVARTREAYDLVQAAMSDVGHFSGSKEEVLHLLEAGSYLDRMATFTTSVAIVRAREAGASWAKLAAAMGVSRSSAQSRYEREPRGS